MYRRNFRFRVVNMKELVGFNFIGFVFYVFFYIIEWFDNNVGYNNLCVIYFDVFLILIIKISISY